MKSSEFHRLAQINGWHAVRQVGSHVIYEKKGRRVVVPYHGSKEIKKGPAMKLRREMNI